jgi:hypothetical protein
MIELGNKIEKSLQDDESQFDDNEIGSGKINLFVRTNNAESTFDIIRPLLGEWMKNLRVAYREVGEDGYAKPKFFVLWPKGAKKFNL